MRRRAERAAEYQLVSLGGSKGSDEDAPPLRRVPSHWEVPDLGSAGAWLFAQNFPSLGSAPAKLKQMEH